MKRVNVGGGRRALVGLGAAVLMAWGLAPAVSAAATASSAGGYGNVSRQVPSQGYYAGKRAMNAGEYREALTTFQFEGRGAINNGQSQWIDSICYHTMIGECYFRMGNLPQALDQYTSALKLFVQFSGWMQRVDFRPIRQAGAGTVKRVPWGASRRTFLLGAFQPAYNISQGQLTMLATQQGGAIPIQSPVLLPINVEEIIRCTTLATLRRGELLGPLRSQDPLQIAVFTQVAQHPGPANHWSESWLDIELGASNVGSGKDAQASPSFLRGVIAGGQFDHPLSALAMLELGILALKQGDYAHAANFFEEATYTAVNYGDVDTLEEAFRYGAITHFMSNQQKPYPLLLPALAWAKRQPGLYELQALLAILGAENCVILNDPHNATRFLEEARRAIARHSMVDGMMGARLNYVTAAAAFQQKRPADGEVALALAMKYMRAGSLWLFHIGLADRQYASGDITPHTAMGLFASVLRDPQAADWASDPMEALSVLINPHPASFEHWFEVAMGRKEYETAMEIGDRLRRHRFFSTLPLGGRLQSLRWLLDGPLAELDQAEQLHRQDILTHYPHYKDLQQQQQQLLERLDGQPPVASSGEALKAQMQDLNQLTLISAQQEAILREMAVRREPAGMVFPPQRTTAAIQKALPPGHALLVFVCTTRRTYAFLLNSQRYTYWQIGPDNQQMQKLVTELLRDMGQYEGNKEFSLKELADEQWKRTAAGTLEQLLKGSAADFSQPFDELVIVPDGVLWYLPFEMLQVQVDKQYQSLLSRFRIRYVPLASMAVPSQQGRKPLGRTAVDIGQLYSRDSEALGRDMFQRLARVLPGCVALPAVLPAPSAVYMALFDRLVVLDQITPSEQNPYSWAPVPLDRGKAGSSLEDWMALPFAGPQETILPGFHTAAENSLKRVNVATAGQDVFLSVCGLLASGSRTVLMSRWRTGGQTSFDLTREFVQELPHTAPADAWQRAVLLTLESQINPDNEPRIKHESAAQLPNATHPFFWAGYLLVDTAGGAQKSEAPADEPVIKVKPKEAAGGAAAKPAGPGMTLGPADLGPAKAAAPAADNPAAPPDKPSAKAKAKAAARRKPSGDGAAGIPPADEK